MNPILDWGISLILFLQSLGTWLIAPMKAFTFLGYEQFYLLLAPVLFWCIDTNVGARMGLLLMISGGLNTALKFAFLDPRPYWYNPQVQAFSTETSFGLPSGHAQNAVAVWGSIAAWLRKPWAWYVAIALMFFIGLSRMYLGVHFPTDVFAGWIIGALLLWIYLRLEPGLLTWIKRFNPAQQTLLAFAGSLLLIVIAVVFRLAAGGWQMPAEWLQNIAIAAPGSETPEPLALSGMFTSAGAFFGLAAGIIGLRWRGGFQIRGTIVQLVIRYVLGVIGVLVIWQGLDILLPGGEDLVGYVCRYLRYALIGLWVTGLAPYLFIRLRLAKTG